MNRPHLLIFIVFLFCLTGFTHGNISYSSEFYYQPGNHSDQVIRLNGNWDFYYGDFLSAKQMDSLPAQEKIQVKVPTNWLKYKKNGTYIPAFGKATYYTKIIVPHVLLHQQRNYAFRIGDITAAYSLFVNDTPILSTGVVSRDSASFRPGYYPKVGFIHTDPDTLRVVIHAENYFYPKFSGISRPVLFGFDEAINREHLLVTSFSVILMSLLAILFLFELIVFIAIPHEKSHILVSLLALIFLIKMLLDNELTIFHIFPDFNFFTGYRIWLSSFIAVPLIYSLIRTAFPGEMPAWATRASHVVYWTYFLLVLILPLPVILNNLQIIIYISFVFVLHLIYTVIIALFRHRRYALIHTVSLMIALICVGYDLITISNPTRVSFVSQIGVSVYLTTQAFIILFRFIGAHKNIVRLSEELEEANEGLENTVLKRTRELQDANIKLEHVNNMKNFMLAITTHDMKNSFNVLCTASGILCEDKSLSEEQLVLADMMRDASNNGYRVLENILSWAKMQMTDEDGIEPIRNLQSFAENEIKSFEAVIEEKKLTVRTLIDNSFLFRCEPHMLESICRNLLSNAIKFSRPGGEILISNRLEGNTVEIRLADNGIGMEPEVLRNIFETTRDKKRRGTSGETGSGLGLIIVKELIEINHGTITCKSQPGKGAEFICRFPKFSE